MDNNKPSLGLLAEYETPEGLMAAAEKVRDGGYKRWDTHTPFPIHGIDDAMGIKPTILPWIVLLAAIAGTTTAVVLQWWTNGVDYPFQISGKPLFSWVPAFPIIFELTVLFAGVTTLFAMLALNRLPRLHNPLFDVERFARATRTASSSRSTARIRCSTRPVPRRCSRARALPRSRTYRTSGPATSCPAG